MAEELVGVLEGPSPVAGQGAAEGAGVPIDPRQIAGIDDHRRTRDLEGAVDGGSDGAGVGADSEGGGTVPLQQIRLRRRQLDDASAPSWSDRLAS